MESKIKFRPLREDEIECRISQIKQGCVNLLLYKDARCDMNLLDETVGAENWQRKHLRDNANCIISIWDSDKCQWIEKEDTGTESNTEKEKGQASDSFKRAGFNWGIGRELYTSPEIKIWANDFQKNPNYTLEKDKSGKDKIYDNFKVSEIKTVNGNITSLKIINTKLKDKLVFNWKSGEPKKAKEPEQDNPQEAEEALKKQCDIYATVVSKTTGIELKEVKKQACDLAKSKDLNKICDALLGWITKLNEDKQNDGV